jgi:hypothetical protein
MEKIIFVIKKSLCVFWGHSNIVRSCFGYITCARCDEQIGDSLGGYWNNPNCVVVGHNCETCQENYKRLSWKDKFLCPNPFERED